MTVSVLERTQGPAMPEQADRTRDIGTLLECESLRDWMGRQRWYAAKSRGISGIELIEQAALPDDLHLALVQARLATGAHDVYQLLLVAHDPGSVGRPVQDPIASSSELEAFDAVTEPRHMLDLLRLMLQDADVRTDHGSFSFRHVEGAYSPAADAIVRAMGTEQSNSSFIIDERISLKVIRRVESGISPELELLRFLTARGFEHIAPLQGWYEYEGSSLASTLGIAQEFVPDGTDGWELALDEVISDPEQLVSRLHSLGEITGQMHTALASDAGDPAFSPQDPSTEALALLTASIDEDIERMFMRLPDTEVVAPIYGCGEDVRAQLATLGQVSSGGKQIRIHGDYHLGQTLCTPRGWVILDFEGEPARPLPQRRQKRSPLKDVAGMLRSFAYVASAVELQRGQRAPDGFEERMREQFLDGYLTAVDPALLPGGRGAIMNILSIFELEKAVYELEYELNNRPDWVAIPVAGIRRLLEAP
jgi:trehalose synthase-fused probable maltokinase